MPQKDLYKEDFCCSLQVVATEFRKLREPKVAKFIGGYSSDASLVFQSWLKDIQVYVLECCLSQQEAIQLVKDYTSCEMVSSLITDFYNQFQKTRETEDVFADELQVLVRKIMACKPKFINDANQALKHQFTQNLRDPYFGVIARGQCLSSPDSESFTQFWGRLALMFNSRGKHCMKAVNASSSAVDCGDTEEHLSHNSRRR